MIVHRIVTLCLLFCVFAAGVPSVAHGHGGVVEEDDLCVIKVSFLRAHFKVYQPDVSGHQQFCEDLPAASSSVFVMEYEHDSLSEMAIDFRIIRDVTGKGRFARSQDIQQIADLEAATVYYRQPVVDPDIYSVHHRFVEEGDFVGIVSARDLQTGKSYTAVFPFEVGFTGLGYWPFFIVLLLLVQVQYLFMSGKIGQWFGRTSAPAALLFFACLVTTPAAFASEYVVSYTAPDGEPKINSMHGWVLHIENASGENVEGAVIEVDGGMPKHDHGLPTKPRVTAELGGGRYQLDGLRFHMSGYWEIVVTITTSSGTSTVTLSLQL